MYLVPPGIRKALEGLQGLKAGTANVGLIYDKFINLWPHWPEEDLDLGAEKWKAQKKGFRDFLVDQIADHLQQHKQVGALLLDLHQRRRTLACRLGGKVLQATTASRLVIGLGSQHPFETGFIFHRTLGVPYIPGSSIKGLLRAWADPGNDKVKGWGALGSRERVFELFGDTDEHGCGRLIILDGLPVSRPLLEIDIVNPHYGPYYRDPAGPPPADYYSPVPVPFLTVAAGQKFEFILLPACGGWHPEDLDQEAKLLMDALQTLGVGGKTAVGYGIFS
ncbi:MAG: type III-B CRISPR module RAMP protein Cmr6 [Firmicutes bacterium]|nr:type III-B CRISPR module RAMP protein Cmr6 [Bacillota bacterium]